jgi:membrane-associated phospholipid phosphatase
LLARLRCNLELKLILLLTVPTITTAAYLVAQRVIEFPVRTVPLTWIDRAIPFDPRWVWGYVSLYLLMPIAPLLARQSADLWRYTRGMLLCFAIGIVCFVLIPVAGPRPTGTPDHWLYGQLILIDRSYNAFPSLHAACAAYAVVYGQIVSRDSTHPRLRIALLALAWCWVAIILYSTIATRQHYLLDLVPGVLLGAACAVVGRLR